MVGMGVLITLPCREACLVTTWVLKRTLLLELLGDLVASTTWQSRVTIRSTISAHFSSTKLILVSRQSSFSLNMSRVLLICLTSMQRVAMLPLFFCSLVLTAVPIGC